MTVSPWHDIPLQVGDGVFNFVVEIPKESSAKMEAATDEPHTPIKQDTNKGKLRYYPYNINWNYGLLPQTWEDPTVADAEVEGAFGDNDPVDVVEIGDSQRRIGEIRKVKPLAALAMIDEGELDWKIIAISLDDPRLLSLMTLMMLRSISRYGTLTAIRDWFRDYKIPDGKPANKFGLGNKAANKEKPTATESPPQQQNYSTIRMGQLSQSSSSRARISAEQKEKKARRNKEGKGELAKGNDGGSRRL
ncbi:soluble inorganic pyrophosphatase 1 [Pyrus ussuriensis x Pyrus communis]|uniref:inorganic diphosphatase n=1 Tax=Pyrus ussuriensis x Pyrus communis TaxID=2448454 RepID=A0A5N5GGB2_9ROSA|nr:soluble inorganic pyrophosphatase 1 [Pyrus ussuriensis x Pyrus communis]